MRLFTLLTALVVLLGVRITYVAGYLNAPKSTCALDLERGQGTSWTPEEVTTCSLSSLESCKQHPLTGVIRLTGTPEKTTWDLSADGDGSLTISEDATVFASCLTVLLEAPASPELQLQPIALSTLFAPPFLLGRGGSVSFLAMRDVKLVLSCDLLLEWQQYLCSTRLPGMAQIHGSIVLIETWQTAEAYLERVSLTCHPGPVPFLPACTLATVETAADILEASTALVEPTLPLVLTLSKSLNFTDATWPEEGLRITANVTLSATLHSTVSISFGLKTLLFTVDSRSSSTAFLSFRGCILKDLPLSYLPLYHPRRPFGILSTGLWPVYREEVAMGLYNCTLIITEEEFKFWSYWLSILISPIPSVRALGNWSYANGVELLPSGDDFIQLSSYYGRYTTLVDVRYQISNSVYSTQQRKNILQITGNPQVPPTVVFQVRDKDDLLDALTSNSNLAAQQHGQYIILTENVTMAASNSSEWPADGAHIRYQTTVTTWPSTIMVLDLRLMRNTFLVDAPVELKNLVLVNLIPGSDEDGYTFATGLWAFKMENWRNADQQRVSLTSSVLLVSQSEVEYYVAIGVDGYDAGDSWMTSFQVDSYDTVNRSWVMFATIATLRFSAQRLNITSTMPHVFNDAAVPSYVSDPGALLEPESGSKKSSERREILLFSLIAITLPTAAGAALLTYIIVKRRRLRRLCTRSSSADGPEAKRDTSRCSMDSTDPEGDEEEQQRTQQQQQKQQGGAKTARHGQQAGMSCCLLLPMPLRRSKYVNPLYDEGGSLAADVVLTGVLGPVHRNRSLTASALQLPAVLSTEALSAADDPIAPAAGAQIPAATSGPAAGSGSSREPADEVVERNGRIASASDAALEINMEMEVSPDGDTPDSGRAVAAAAAAAEAAQPSGGVAVCSRGASENSSHICGGWGGGSGSALEPRPGMHGAGPPPSCAAAAARCYGYTSRSVESSSGLSAGVSTTLPQPPMGPERPQCVGAACQEEGMESAQADAERLRSGGEAEAGPGTGANARDSPRRGSGRGPGPGPQLDMQRLEQLQRDIGDRHLEVQHSLGWGGCGVVYKGTWKGLQVAVKTVLVQGDSKQSRQFLTEAAISASLQHINVVTTYLYELRPLDEVEPRGSGLEIRVQSLSSDDSQPSREGPGRLGHERMACWKLYIVQEYCEMGTLKSAIDQGYFKGARGSMPNMAFLLAIALDVANGLTHIHSKNVVHGDVTVSNVLLQTHPARPHGCIAKVADFGLSVKLEAGQSHNSHMYGGTPHYMAPERARGMLSKTSDIYSLGVCLWELYCGTPPWRRNTAGAGNRHYPDNSGSSVDSRGSDMGVPHHLLYDSGGGGSGGVDSFPFPRNCPAEYVSLVGSCLAAEMQRRPTAAAVVATLQRLLRRYG